MNIPTKPDLEWLRKIAALCPNMDGTEDMVGVVRRVHGAMQACALQSEPSNAGPQDEKIYTKKDAEAMCEIAIAGERVAQQMRAIREGRGNVGAEAAAPSAAPSEEGVEGQCPVIPAAFRVPMWLVGNAANHFAAWPRKTQAEVYASGFRVPPEIIEGEFIVVGTLQPEHGKHYAVDTAPVFGAVRDTAALLEQRSGGQWISVSERLPDEDGRLWAVLSDTVNLGIVTGYYPLCEYYHFNDGWATDERITHWLDVKLPPLPAAPQGWSES